MNNQSPLCLKTWCSGKEDGEAGRGYDYHRSTGMGWVGRTDGWMGDEGVQDKAPQNELCQDVDYERRPQNSGRRAERFPLNFRHLPRDRISKRTSTGISALPVGIAGKDCLFSQERRADIDPTPRLCHNCHMSICSSKDPVAFHKNIYSPRRPT